MEAGREMDRSQDEQNSRLKETARAQEVRGSDDEEGMMIINRSGCAS